MQAIADNVYIEEQYPGVTLGLIVMPHGLIQIDAPPSPDDGRAWRASLLNLGDGGDRVLINLDTHPDRTIGARQMDCTVIAHEKTANLFRNRPTSFKPQAEATGADSESIAGLGNIRWVVPEISFSQQMSLHWGSAPVLLEYHPGPATGAIWVALPEEKVVFVGDAVVKNQPPYLASANLPLWIEALNSLLGSDYRGHAIVSGRNGMVAAATIRNQLDYLKKILVKLEKLAAKDSPPDAIENLIPPLLASLKITAAQQKRYTQRLRYGLQQYYIRHYRTAGGSGDE